MAAEDELVPTDREDYIRRMIADRDAARSARIEAGRSLGEETPPMSGGQVFGQVLTSVLPVILGAAIAGKRGGAVGAETGAALQPLFLKDAEDRSKQKALANKTQFQEMQDLEKASQAKLASATEGMFRDEQADKRAAERDDRFSQSLNASSERAANAIAAAADRTQKGIEERQKRQDHAADLVQEAYNIPIAPRKLNSEGKPMRVDGKEFTDSRKVVDGYLGLQPYADNLRGALKSGDTQKQVEAWTSMINQLKQLRNFGAAFTDTEFMLTSAGLPPIGDVTKDGILRWVRGKARGGNMDDILTRFNETLGKEVQYRLQKYDFTPPPPYGQKAKTKSGKIIQYTGTVGRDGKPNYEVLNGDS